MLEIKDLKAEDELEFISEVELGMFIRDHALNKNLIDATFTNGKCKIEQVTVNSVILHKRTVNGLGDIIFQKELKYFRKVETKKEGDLLDSMRVTMKGIHNSLSCDMSLVNAGINNVKQMYRRLMDGEVFYYKEHIYTFDGNSFYTKWNTYKESGIASPEKFTEFQVQKPWYEFASKENPILCKVWDNDSDGKMYQVEYDLVIGIDKDEPEPFVCLENGTWMNATPVKPSECFQGG